MDAVLRPYDLGATQWSVLHQLAHDGPTRQRDLVRALQVERATLSGIVAALVRKGLVEQVADRSDQRQRVLRMTAAGARLWKTLPNLAAIHDAAFKGLNAADVAAAVRVLRAATERLEKYIERT